MSKAELARRDLATVLDQIDRVLSDYVAFPIDEARHAVVLWVVHSWLTDVADSTPRLALVSAEKQSGKTRTLELLAELAWRPLHAANASTAAVFRLVDKVREDEGLAPTILLDEVDTIFGHNAPPNEDLRGLVNAGHRRGATVARVVGEGGKMSVHRFEAFAPVALAGIGDLPDTIMDRALVIRMRRRRPDQHVVPFRFRHATRQLEPIRERLTEHREAFADLVDGVDPELPDGVVDRPADVWEPLLAIGQQAGDAWAARSAAACKTLVGTARSRDAEDGSLGVRLLRDLRDVWPVGERYAFSDEPLTALHGLVEAPWADLRGRPLDARGLARLLKPYEVRSGDRRRGDTVRRGYDRDDLHDAWARYLPPAPESATGTTGATEPAHIDSRSGRSGGSAPERGGEQDGSHVPTCEVCGSNPPISDPPPRYDGLCLSCAESSREVAS